MFGELVPDNLSTILQVSGTGIGLWLIKLVFTLTQQMAVLAEKVSHLEQQLGLFSALHGKPKTELPR